MQKESVTDKVKNLLGGGHGQGHTHDTGVTGTPAGTQPGGVVQQTDNAVTGQDTNGVHAGTPTGTHPGFVQKIENAVTGHGTRGTHAGTQTATQTGAQPGFVQKIENAITGLGTRGTPAGTQQGFVQKIENIFTGHGTRGTHTAGPGTGVGASTGLGTTHTA